MYPAKMAEPVEIPFGMWGGMDTNNHVLDVCMYVQMALRIPPEERAILGWIRGCTIVKYRQHKASATEIRLAQSRWHSVCGVVGFVGALGKARILQWKGTMLVGGSAAH